MRPHVSVIIDNYNYGQFLGEAIASALAQTYPDTEVIVVDDGSTDGSRAIIAGFGDRITAVLKDNAGQASAFNAGFARVMGDIVIFLDADDLLAPEAAALASAAFAPDVAKVHWPLWRIDADGVRDGRVYPDGRLIEGDFRLLLLRDGPDHHVIPPNSPPTSGNAWSVQHLRQLMPIPEAPYRAGADNYLLNLIPLFGRIAALRQPLGEYRSHGGNDTKTPLAPYAEAFVTRHETCRAAMARIFAEQGVPVAPDAWPRDTWFHRVAAAAPEFARAVPEGASFLLVAEAEWHTAEFMPGRRRIPFVDADGVYAGDPRDDDHGVAELRRACGAGARYIAFPWTKFWYPDVHPRFMAFLEGFATEIVTSPSWRIFRLPE